MPGNASRILDFVKDLRREPEELAHIIVTHGHIDHASSVTELRHLTGAKAAAHKDEETSAGDGTFLRRIWRGRGDLS